MDITCALHNSIIAQLPSVIPNSYVIPSEGCTCASDNIHFTVSGYRTMGKRYAYEALKQLGVATQAQADYTWNANQKKIYALKQLDQVEDITLRVGGSKVLKIWGTFEDGHREILTNECTLSSADFTPCWCSISLRHNPLTGTMRPSSNWQDPWRRARPTP